MASIVEESNCWCLVLVGSDVFGGRWVSFVALDSKRRHCQRRNLQGVFFILQQYSKITTVISERQACNPAGLFGAGAAVGSSSISFEFFVVGQCG